jgi:hypothetical protein
MLNFGADFWTSFWAVIGGSAALAVLASIVVANFTLDWFRCEPATVHTLPTDEQPVQTSEAA